MLKEETENYEERKMELDNLVKMSDELRQVSIMIFPSNFVKIAASTDASSSIFEILKPLSS